MSFSCKNIKVGEKVGNRTIYKLENVNGTETDRRVSSRKTIVYWRDNKGKEGRCKAKTFVDWYNSKHTLGYATLSDEECLKLAEDIMKDKVVTDLDCLGHPPDIMPMVFRILDMLTPKQISTMADDPPGMVYEYVDKAKEGLEVNGLPVFFSLHAIDEDSANKVLNSLPAAMEKIEEAQKSLEAEQREQRKRKSHCRRTWAALTHAQKRELKRAWSRSPKPCGLHKMSATVLERKGLIEETGNPKFKSSKRRWFKITEHGKEVMQVVAEFLDLPGNS